MHDAEGHFTAPACGAEVYLAAGDVGRHLFSAHGVQVADRDEVFGGFN